MPITIPAAGGGGELVITTGINFTSFEQNGWRDLTFEMPSNTDDNQFLIYPIAFSVAPHPWDVQISMRDQGEGNPPPAVVNNGVLFNGVFVNRTDGASAFLFPHVLVRIRGLI